MSVTALDLRWLTAIALVLIGISLTAWTIRVYWMSPIRRADLFGPYVKEAGLRSILSAWPALFVLGVFLIIAGISKGVFYARWHGTAGTEVANAIGVIEALFSIWAAGSVMIVTVRAWSRK